MNIVTTLLSLASLAVITVSCGNTTVAGATSETTNGIQIAVVSSTGAKVSGASVYLAKANEVRALNNFDTLPVAKTDQSGFFKLETLDTVDYIIEVSDTSGHRAMSRITYNSTLRSHVVDRHIELHLAPIGRLFGTVEKIPGQKVYIQAYGLRRIIETDSTGYFSFKDLPAGDVRIKITTGTEIVSEDPFSVKSNKGTDAGTYTIGTTDEQIVRYILDLNGRQDISVDSVTERQGKNHRITSLDLDSMGINTLPKEIGKLRLTSLTLSRNNLTYVPEELFDLTRLDYLDLSGNKLTSISESIFRLHECSNLDIGENELTSLPNSIVNMENLENVYLNYNHLIHLPAHIKDWVDSNSDDDGWEKTQH